MKLVKARIAEEDYLYIFGKVKSKGITVSDKFKDIIRVGLFFTKRDLEDKPVYIREDGRYVRIDLATLEPLVKEEKTTGQNKKEEKR